MFSTCMHCDRLVLLHRRAFFYAFYCEPAPSLIFGARFVYVSCSIHLRVGITLLHHVQVSPTWLSWNMPTMHTAMITPRINAQSPCIAAPTSHQLLLHC